MTNLTQLRLAAREIFDEALRAVDARAALRNAIKLEGSRLTVCGTVTDLAKRPVYAIAIGKAALAMAAALEEVLDDKLAAGVLSCNMPGHETALRHWQTFQGGHPEPNDQSLAAAQACFELLGRANQERALVVFLISGGGSSMLEWPLFNNISLSDLQATHRTLVRSGAPIDHINSVRQVISAVKNGRLAEYVPDCEQVTLIVSDVPPGEEADVASGPTLPPLDRWSRDLRRARVVPGFYFTRPRPPDTFLLARNLPRADPKRDRYKLRAGLPDTVCQAIDNYVKDHENDRHEAAAHEPARRHFGPHWVLLDNRSAVVAASDAARERGFKVTSHASDGPIENGCARLRSDLGIAWRDCRGKELTVCVISGGEFTCPVKGAGLGGRNLETALRLAISRGVSDSELFVALCAGTDGIDGNSPAAGAIVDSTTIERATRIGLDPQDFLNRSDAYSFFVALGDVIATGPTGTNVRDLRILLRGS